MSWKYRVTIHSADDILALADQPADAAPPTVFCNDAGACYFDGGPNPYTRAIEQLLNKTGRDQWELVQVTFRPDQLIGFWKKPVE